MSKQAESTKLGGFRLKEQTSSGGSDDRRKCKNDVQASLRFFLFMYLFFVWLHPDLSHESNAAVFTQKIATLTSQRSSSAPHIMKLKKKKLIVSWLCAVQFILKNVKKPSNKSPSH